jgi:hypothetical protein
MHNASLAKPNALTFFSQGVLLDKNGSYLLSNIVCTQEVDVDHILNLFEATEKVVGSISFNCGWRSQDTMANDSPSQDSKPFNSQR